jgi:hypothetical protein
MLSVCGCTKSKQVLNENSQQQETLKMEKGYPIFIYVDSKKLWGYIDEKGNEIIKPQYDKVTDFSDKGTALVYKNIPESFYEFDSKPLESGVIDISGKEIIPVKNQIVRMLGNEYYAVSDENFNNTEVFDSKGNIAFKKEGVKVSGFSEGVFLFEEINTKKMGSLDEKGEIIDKQGNVVPKEWNSSGTEAYWITPNPNNQYERLWGIRDKSGKVILKPEYSEVTNIWNDVFLVSKDWNNYGLVDGTGNFIINNSDKPITYLGDGLVALSSKPESRQAARYLKNALFDLKTKNKTDYKYYFVYDEYWGYVESKKSIERLSVSDDKNSFIIDRNGNLIEGAKVVDGYYRVTFDGNITKVENQGVYHSSYVVNAYYDKSGKLIWKAPEFNILAGNDAVIKTVLYQPSVAVRIEYPQISGMKDKSIEDKLNKRFLDLSGLNETKEEIEEKDFVYTYAEWFNTTISDKLLTIQLSSYMDSFGAHGNGFTTYKHFDLVSGREFLLKDLFKANSEFKVKLGKIVSKQYNSRADYQKEIEVKDDTDFYFLKDGIMIFYSQDMIASHAEGNIELFVKFDEIKDILNKEADIFKLINLEKYKIYDYKKKSEEDIERLMQRYEYCLVDAINNNNFKLVEEFLATSGPLYGQQQQLIESLKQQNISESIESMDVIKIEAIPDNKWTVIVKERIGVTKNNQKNIMDFTWKYTVLYNPETQKYSVYSLEKAS